MNDDETDEMRAAYAAARVGDPPIFRRRFNLADPNLVVEYCGYEWSDDPRDAGIEGAVWGCSRSPGHEPPHVAEGFTAIFAIHEEE